ncbi:MAG: hypothetical protein HY340_03090 [Candidatus Kerfeldbacteria bacterium]|nr:hypothetical protein [Candidatus Kerfeldbacteria bacterium]
MRLPTVYSLDQVREELLSFVGTWDELVQGERWLGRRDYADHSVFVEITSGPPYLVAQTDYPYVLRILLCRLGSDTAICQCRLDGIIDITFSEPGMLEIASNTRERVCVLVSITQDGFVFIDPAANLD